MKIGLIGQIIISSIIGVYTAYGLNVYSKIIQRTKNDLLRLVVFVIAGVLFFFLPVLLFGKLFLVIRQEGEIVYSFTCLMVWSIVNVGYIIPNNKVFLDRLGPHKDFKSKSGVAEVKWGIKKAVVYFVFSLLGYFAVWFLVWLIGVFWE